MRDPQVLGAECHGQGMDDLRENVAVRQVFNNAFTAALGLANGTQPRRPGPDALKRVLIQKTGAVQSLLTAIQKLTMPALACPLLCSTVCISAGNRLLPGKI